MIIIKYNIPDNWIKFDQSKTAVNLINAKAAVMTLGNTPFERGWVKNLQQMELKREIAGTSKIEGADFTDREFEIALMEPEESAEELQTRSQRQARAAKYTYTWIADLPNDKIIDEKLISEIHRGIVTGADNNHCIPGTLRRQDQNVTFGRPRHRGVEGGKECTDALGSFVGAIKNIFGEYDPLIQALASHYHLAAMHPFLDGNGRTARALESLMLQRAGLHDFCFIAMSNYYYDEKNQYLEALANVRANNHDLTPFLNFALKGIEIQSKRVIQGIQREISKALYRNMMYDLFGRLKTSRKRFLAKRQLEILNILLREDEILLDDIISRTGNLFSKLQKPEGALLRDLNDLIRLGAITHKKDANGRNVILPILEWPTQITESEFMEKIKIMPKAKGHLFTKD